MSNLYGLTDGTNFIKDCNKAEDPTQSRKEKLTFLLSLNLETMPQDKLWTNDAVRALATCLIPTYGENSKRKNKNELIEGLKKAQEAERQVRASMYAEVLELHNKADDFDRDLNLFMSMLADESIKQETLATGALKLVEKRYHTLTSVTKRGIPLFKDAVRSHPSAAGIAKERLEGVLKALSSLRTQDNKNISAEYAKEVTHNARNRTLVYPSYLYEHTLKVLSDPSAFMWKDVSIAMSFATGRRMSEIHTSLTWFKEVEGDEYRVLFYGQRKKKLDKVKEFEIPTIVPAKMVLAGWKYLKEEGRIYDTTQQVNTLLNKGLNSELPLRLKELYKLAGIEIYHDIRCLYGLVMESKKPEEYTVNAWYSYLLGHNETDLSTSNSYQAYFTREQFDPIDNHPTYTDRVESTVEPSNDPIALEWDAFDALDPDTARP